MIEKAIELFNAKLRTGLYKDYDTDMLDILFEDCMNQVGLETKTIERR